MSRATILAAGRAAAEEGMVDACTIRRRTGQAEDLDTGVVTPTYATVYSGKCRIQARGHWGEQRDVGQADVVVLTLEVQLPNSVTGLQVADQITIDASVHDPDLPGRVLAVKDLNHKSHATARRPLCTEVTG